MVEHRWYGCPAVIRSGSPYAHHGTADLMRPLARAAVPGHDRLAYAGRDA
jgi:hypothetical protein